MSDQKKASSNFCLSRRSFLFLGSAALAGRLAIASKATAESVTVERSTITSIPFYKTSIDLTDPFTFLAIGLANNSTLDNPEGIIGDESFERMVARYHAAVVANGTFFGKDDPKSLIGNIVSAGRFVKYSPGENHGTTLGLRAGNQPEMLTARVDGQPLWTQYWFSLTAGPRLLRGGKTWLAPRTEGFTDPHVMGVAHRCAIGFPASGKKLILVTFLKPLPLWREAQLMRAIGCSEAMNLDGGASIALSQSGTILVRPKREQTNVIVVYDTHHKAPTFLQQRWLRFQMGERPTLPEG
ncbi:MAG TPA: Tat pathway signal sequence domain protein [Cyanobacteria bacterium UBA8803]|nr:Tat pathway signal sequence domain protein [Cyanobacteria bacterium UBA9273]HBL57075.1 Tat pathway signal sequence domain protein [Cyanobacteria bacterium UBA8803]